MRRWFLSLFLLLATCGVAQTDNTFYVKQFPGATVGIKATNAQLACNANVGMKCLIIFDPSLALYQAGTMPAKCAQCVWIDWRTGGVNPLTVSTLTINTNGTSVLLSTKMAASTAANNIWIGGGGQNVAYDGTNAYSGSDNTANGNAALYSNTTGYNNTANGYQALYFNTTGNNNTANGDAALYSNTFGYQNTANGYKALYSNTTGYYNTANGYQALYFNTAGYYNTANGYKAGQYIADGVTNNQTSNNSVYVGFGAYPLANGDTNENVIGNTAIGYGSNTSTLGNASITDTYLRGNVHAAALSLSGTAKVYNNITTAGFGLAPMTYSHSFYPSGDGSPTTTIASGGTSGATFRVTATCYIAGVTGPNALGGRLRLDFDPGGGVITTSPWLTCSDVLNTFNSIQETIFVGPSKIATIAIGVDLSTAVNDVWTVVVEQLQ